MLTASPLLLTNETKPQTLLAGAAQQANDPFAWIDQTKVPPLQQGVSADTLRFDDKLMTLQPDTSRALGNRSRTAPNEQRQPSEMSAFEFRK
jgi:hypothetical protein